MEISEEEAAALLNHDDNLLKPGRDPEVIYRRPHNGSRNGGRAVPPMLRELVAVAAHHDTIASVAESFGLSPSTVAQAKKGNVGVNRHDPELAERIENHVGEAREKVRDAALDRLAGLFASVITEDKLGTLPVRVAVGVGKDLATIAEKVSEKKESGPKVIFINQVRVKDESEYGPPIILEHREEK